MIHCLICGHEEDDTVPLADSNLADHAHDSHGYYHFMGTELVVEGPRPADFEPREVEEYWNERWGAR